MGCVRRVLARRWPSTSPGSVSPVPTPSGPPGPDLAFRVTSANRCPQGRAMPGGSASGQADSSKASAPWPSSALPSRWATHSETQEASAGFLAVALTVVAYSGSLCHSGADRGAEARDAPSSEPGARPTPLPCPPSHQELTPLPFSDPGAIQAAPSVRGRAGVLGEKGQLLMYLIQHVSKRESLACVAPGLRFAALRKPSPQ